MKKISEIMIALAMIVIVFFKIDPFHWFMPTNIQMILLCLLVTGVIVWVGMIFREKAHDERESYHLYRASRAGYIVGVLSLSLLVVIRDIQHKLDPLLLVVLALMVLAKLVVLKISEFRD